MMQIVRFAAGALLLTAGLLVCIVGVIGVFKFRYAANRMHSAAVNDTLGISLCMLGLAVLAPDLASALKLLLVIFFFWVSAPVASHLLCRLEVETNEKRGEEMEVHLLERSETDEEDNAPLFGRQTIEGPVPDLNPEQIPDTTGTDAEAEQEAAPSGADELPAPEPDNPEDGGEPEEMTDTEAEKVPDVSETDTEQTEDASVKEDITGEEAQP